MARGRTVQENIGMQNRRILFASSNRENIRSFSVFGPAFAYFSAKCYIFQERQSSGNMLKRLILVAATILISLSFVLTESGHASARSDPTIYDIDINHSSTFWGIPMDSDTCGGTPPVGTCSPTPAWHIRAAFAYLMDKTQVVTSLGLSTSNIIDNMVPSSSYYTTPSANPWYLDV